MVSRFNDLAAWLNDSYHRLHSYHNKGVFQANKVCGSRCEPGEERLRL